MVHFLISFFTVGDENLDKGGFKCQSLRNSFLLSRIFVPHISFLSPNGQSSGAKVGNNNKEGPQNVWHPKILTENVHITLFDGAQPESIYMIRMKPSTQNCGQLTYEIFVAFYNNNLYNNIL